MAPRGSHTFPWPADACDLLRKYWAQGASASYIAGRINAACPGAGIDRNAVIGKAHRLKLQRDANARLTGNQRGGENSWRDRRNKPSWTPKDIAAPKTPGVALAPSLEKPSLADAPAKPEIAWTAERVAQLTALWMAGHTAAYIAGCLGDVSGAAVVAKAHRMKLVRLPSTSELNRRIASRANAARQAERPRIGEHFPKSTAVNLNAPPPQPETPEANRPPIGIADLTSTNCHWPIGDPLEPDFGFCGCPRDPRSTLSPYCAAHYRRSVSREVVRRRRRAA